MTILIADDVQLNRKLVRSALHSEGYTFLEATNGVEALELLQAATEPMIGLIDWEMPGMDGVDVCRKARERPNSPPLFLILVTVRNSQKDIRHGLQLGSNDYITKPFDPGELLARVRIGVQMVELQHRLSEAAQRDPLTGLYDRQVLMSSLTEKCKYCKSGALLCIDMDQFKLVNDTLGHSGGDELLRQAAHLFEKSIRPGDVAARQGGDEFLILLNDVNLEQVAEIADRICLDFSNLLFGFGGKSMRTTISVGAAMYQLASLPEEVVRNADAACYRAKSQGRNRVVFYDAAKDFGARDEIGWQARLIDGVKKELFQVWLQPVIETASGSVRSHDAIVYLAEPNRELVSSNIFRPLAERLGVVHPVDLYVLGKVREYLSEASDMDISLKISPHTLKNDHICEELVELFPERDDRVRLTLEISEVDLISHRLKRSTLRAIQDLGFKVAIDGYGEAINSFSYLYDIPTEYLKVSGSLMGELENRPVARHLIKAINELALGYQSVMIAEEAGAEGETIWRDLNVLQVRLGEAYFPGALVTSTSNRLDPPSL